jgi:S-adenosylmethionine synthetase
MTRELRLHHRSAEAATRGHPDKIADQIADSLVDAMLEQDLMGRCGVEVLVNANVVVVSGEFKTHAKFNVREIVQRTLEEIGYRSPDLGFTSDCPVFISMRSQSPEIAAVLDGTKEPGASDQGVMYGYATTENDALMPLPCHLAHELVRCLDHLRLSGILPYLRPDGKAQVTVGYDAEEVPVGVSTVVIAAQHHPDIDIEMVRQDVIEQVVHAVIPSSLLQPNTQIIINRLGRFTIGGPAIDTGVTGRKIVADTYGGLSRIGGGALCGKDPSKLDRTGAYYGRYVAKNVVAAGLARRCQIELAYAFAELDPVATTIETFGTGTVREDDILEWIRNHFHFRPAEMVEELNLRHPIYRPTATYGHFGWPEFSWEQILSPASFASS